jgi:hypothetical protein
MASKKAAAKKKAGLVLSNKQDKSTKREPLGKISMVTTPAEFVTSFLSKSIKTAIEEYGATSMRGTITFYK